MALYDLENLVHSYSGRNVLDIDRLVIEPGRIYTLSGPNGSGKTTLLNILAFLLRPDGGRVRFKDHPVHFSGNLRALRRTAILVDQRPVMFSTTVYKNIEFGLRARRIPRAQRRDIIESALGSVGLTRYLHTDARRLSGGETRRVAIARALACAPEVLLLDEPTAELDPESRFAIEEIIRKIDARRETTIILSTHNPVQAARLSGKPVFLLDGRILPEACENIFRCQAIEDAGGRRFCRIHPDVAIPAPAGFESAAKLTIPPGSIRITGDEGDSDGGYSLRGRIVELAEDGTGIRAVIDVGVPLNIKIERERYRSLKRGIGDIVRVAFDPAAVRVIEKRH